MDGKVAIVTGGASGIGFSLAKALFKIGYRVIVADITNTDSAAKKIDKSGEKVLGFKCDVTSSTETIALVNYTISQFGGLDLLVNNAAIFTALILKPFDQIDPEEWMKVMEVNTLGPFLCAKAAVPAMRNRGGGRIVNIASTSQMKGAPFMLHYTSSKGAVIAFTRSLARELGNEKITVNAIAPGFTLSEGVLSAGMEKKMNETVRVSGRSIQRDQVPEDLIAGLLMFASDDASFITGQTLAIDGGGVFL